MIMTLTITRSTFRRSAALLAAAGLAATMGACSNDSAPAGDTTTSAASGGDGKDKTAAVTVVTSTNTWSDVAKTVAGDANVNVTPIVDGQDSDPHSFEPSPQDMALIEQADIVVAGGGHYDMWMTNAAEGTDAVVISALDAEDGHDHDHEGEHAHEGEHGHDHGEEGHDHGHDHDHGDDSTDVEANEHIFYSTEAIDAVGHKLVDAINDKAGGDVVNTDALHEKLEAIKEAKDKLGHYNVAQTHPLGDFILQNTEVHDMTPEGYRKATFDEQEPSAADVNAMLELIKSGDLTFLVNSPQTADPVSERLVEAAEAKGLPIVDVWETPKKGQSFFDLYLQTLEEMHKTGDAAAK